MSTRNLRVDLYRDTEGKWRWRARVPGHILADSGQGYSRRIDCLKGSLRVVGVTEVTWFPMIDNKVYDYGQSSLGRGGVEFYIWKMRRRQVAQR